MREVLVYAECRSPPKGSPLPPCAWPVHRCQKDRACATVPSFRTLTKMDRCQLLRLPEVSFPSDKTTGGYLRRFLSAQLRLKTQIPPEKRNVRITQGRTDKRTVMNRTIHMVCLRVSHADAMQTTHDGDAPCHPNDALRWENRQHTSSV